MLTAANKLIITQQEKHKQDRRNSYRRKEEIFTYAKALWEIHIDLTSLTMPSTKIRLRVPTLTDGVGHKTKLSSIGQNSNKNHLLHKRDH